MSQFQNSDNYKQYKLLKSLKENSDYINDFTDIVDSEVYCDLCDRKLIQWEQDKLICPACHIVSSPKFTVLKHKAREGPVDGDIETDNDISGLSESYSFKTKQEEKPDAFINSLKAKGFQIISSTKK